MDCIPIPSLDRINQAAARFMKEAGEVPVIAFRGEIGAGKTTLLRLLYMGESATTGQIVVDGLNLSRIARRRVPFLRRKFGIIFQDYRLIPSRSVFDNIALVVEAVGTKRQLIRKTVMSLLRTVGMEDRWRALPPSLSVVIVDSAPASSL